MIDNEWGTLLRSESQLLFKKFENKFDTTNSLPRSLTNSRGNQSLPIHRCYKFREAFSFYFVKDLLCKYDINGGKVLDPFAGSGTVLFAASSMSVDAEGIELLPVCHEIIDSKNFLICECHRINIEKIKTWVQQKPWKKSTVLIPVENIRIVYGAYPEETRKEIEKYMGAIQNESLEMQIILRFALLCILESISFTQKDGQYLRWDSRSRHNSKNINFYKKEISGFEEAICRKLNEIVEDVLRLQSSNVDLCRGTIYLHKGSCLNMLPHINECCYDAIITSPPYCNRYDYTRTYALELSLLGIEDSGILSLRQQMLSSTVENRPKNLASISSQWGSVIETVEQQKLLKVILEYFNEQKKLKKINNNGIPRMIGNYFSEMACVIYECFRVLKRGGIFLMVNDNVRYGGITIPVDLILSDIAREIGFQIESIVVLQNNKGNSSQQMKQYGRDALRKCLYVWKK